MHVQEFVQVVDNLLQIRRSKYKACVLLLTTDDCQLEKMTMPRMTMQLFAAVYKVAGATKALETHPTFVVLGFERCPVVARVVMWKVLL